MKTLFILNDPPYGTERCYNALLDRLTHHVHILEMNGESYRLVESRHRRKNNRQNKSD